ncbi:DUF58 domain-containing protein [Ferruginivarius sediminum]|uniref:DUF58 domain-containing protein n=1 Tax=Ferruginivarius sediminum TaxID=2661937 RepID=A0A369T8P5_9PROT|nr:DUF58 domain-containing protein [Ferruginivarius sediminum]RDD61673.1 DUF58 domain-containing protein [Ferruginivarius sediminum]
MATPALTARQRAEQLAATLPPLLLAAERVATTVAQGVHGRRRVGQGETFWQYRDYQPGDPPPSIDWRQSAKSDRVFVRQLEWEAAQSVWMWRDASASMTWRSNRNLPTKRERAELLMLALMVLMVRAGEHVTLLGTGMPPAAGRGTLGRLSEALTREGTGDSDLPPPEPLPRAAQVVLFGDFLAPLESVERCLRDFAERGVSGHLVQVLDPAEETLPYEGRVRFEGLEGEQPWLLSRVEGVRGAYRRRLRAQEEGIAAIARRTGWSCTWHRTDRPPQTALLAIYGALTAFMQR